MIGLLYKGFLLGETGMTELTLFYTLEWWQ